jgi:uncharacterized protein (DUF983 family)
MTPFDPTPSPRGHSSPMNTLSPTDGPNFSFDCLECGHNVLFPNHPFPLTSCLACGTEYSVENEHEPH